MLSQIWSKTKYFIRDQTINRRNRKRLVNKSCTIIANDCTGGMIYHDLKMKFDSPTINLYMDAQDYIKFLSNLEYYLSIDLEEKVNCRECPCGKLDDITLYFLHYQTFDQALDKWEKRKKRIHANNIFYIFNDRNNCTEQDALEFLSLNLPNKLFFTSNPKFKNGSGVDADVCVLKKFSGMDQVGVMTEYCAWYTVKRNYDFFDYISWLNGEMGEYRNEKQK